MRAAATEPLVLGHNRGQLIGNGAPVTGGQRFGGAGHGPHHRRRGPGSAGDNGVDRRHIAGHGMGQSGVDIGEGDAWFREKSVGVGAQRLPARGGDIHPIERRAVEQRDPIGQQVDRRPPFTRPVNRRRQIRVIDRPHARGVTKFHGP